MKVFLGVILYGDLRGIVRHELFTLHGFLFIQVIIVFKIKYPVSWLIGKLPQVNHCGWGLNKGWRYRASSYEIYLP